MERERMLPNLFYELSVFLLSKASKGTHNKEEKKKGRKKGRKETVQ
jgi:hypothetical protein